MPGGRPRKKSIGPKKPLCAYTLFVAEVKPEVARRHSGLSFKELAVKVGEMWRCLPAHDREKYEALAEQDRCRYRHEKEVWEREAAILRMKGLPTVTLRRKKIEGAPKNPLSAYTFFLMENRRNVQKAHPDWSFKEVSVEVGKRWKGQTQEMRQKYEKKAKADKRRYQDELKVWSEKRRGILKS